MNRENNRQINRQQKLLLVAALVLYSVSAEYGESWSVMYGMTSERQSKE